MDGDRKVVVQSNDEAATARAAGHRGERVKIDRCSATSSAASGPPCVSDRPPPQGLLRFYWHFVRQTRGLYRRDVRHRPGGGDDRHLDPGLHRQARRPDAVERPRGGDRGAKAGLIGMALLVVIGRPARAARRQPRAQQRRRARRDQPDPLAEPLARRAPELAVLPERLRRPHRQPRHADRQRGARVRRLEHPRDLVHRDLRHQRARADGSPTGASPCRRRCWAAGYVFFLRLLRAAHARPRQDLVGGALARDGPGRRQLHQHPHRQALRPSARRGRVRARRHRPAHRRDRRAHAPHHPLHGDAGDDERAAAGVDGGDRHRRSGARARSARRSSRPRCRWRGRSPTSRAGSAGR